MLFGVESTDVKIVIGNDKAFSMLESKERIMEWVSEDINVTIDLK